MKKKRRKLFMENMKEKDLGQNKYTEEENLNNEKPNTKMSAPWLTYYRKVVSMFGNDPDIKCSFKDEDEKVIELLVDNQAKANALSKILPSRKEFGGVDVDIVIKPSNIAESMASVYKTAFLGNPIFNDVIAVEGVYDNPVIYVMFNAYIAQFWDDNLGDPHGNYTTLPQNLAQDIFDDGQGVIYSTVQINE